MTLSAIKKGLAAFLLSVLTPGLGQIYNGELLKGALSFGGLIGLLFVSSALGLLHSFNGLIVHIVLLLLTYLFLLGDALFMAVRQARKGQRPVHTWRSYALGLSLLSANTFVLPVLVPNRIPGVHAYKMTAESMLPTLASEDGVIADTTYYRGHPPTRGDLIIFEFPYLDHPVYIKRVIGVPGDRVKIMDQQVYLNGQLLSEPYVAHDPAAYDPYGDNFPPTTTNFLQRNVRAEWGAEILAHVKDGELVVPPTKYFVMGDNRDHSYDSRYWGFVARDKIFGKALYIYRSKDKTRIGQFIR